MGKIKTLNDYGIVELNSSNRIVKFLEKENKGNRKNVFSNVGIYLFNQSILPLIPYNTVYSLESDLFPKLINRKFYGYLTKEHFIDIGTPERYKPAKQRLIKVLY